jgi:hypothetical protein
MVNSVEKNKAFLHNIYSKGPFQGHAFCCSPEYPALFEHPQGEFTLSDKPVELWVDTIVSNYEKAKNLQEKVGDDSVPIARIWTGTHIYAAAFGCQVHCPKDDNPFAKPLVNSPQQADKITEPKISDSPTIYRIFELARKVQDKVGKDVNISVPDMQSGFDTAALIWNKEDLFC